MTGHDDIGGFNTFTWQASRLPLSNYTTIGKKFKMLKKLVARNLKCLKNWSSNCFLLWK